MNSSWRDGRPALILAIIFGLIICVYVVVKASVLSFTHDESYSYLHFPHASFMDIISYKDWFNNNHLLNTLFMKYSEQLFGNSEIALRLPNLLLLPIYMAYSFLFFRKSSALLSIATFVLLCTNSLLLDLFGLARGYGLSFGFMVMSLYHFIAYTKAPTNTHLILFHVGAMLAVLSHFTLVTVYAVLLLVHNILVQMEHRSAPNKWLAMLRSNKAHILPLAVATLVLYEPLRRVVTYNNFDAGGKSGFYSDTVDSLITHSIPAALNAPGPLLVGKILLTLLVIAPLLVIIKNLIQGNDAFTSKNKGLIVSNFLLVFLSFSIIFLHYVNGSDYPVGRFCMFLYPIVVVQIGFFAHYLISNGRKTASIKTMVVLAALSTTTLAFKLDLGSTAEWRYDSETKRVVKELVQQRLDGPSNTTKVELGINWLFEPTLNYYRITWGLDWLSPLDREGVSSQDDYFYIFKEDQVELEGLDLQVIFRSKEANTVLLKNKTPFDER